MGRPLGKGLTYFPCDTDWNREMRLFKAKHGLRGVGFMVELWRTIYRNGYYYPWDEETQQLFADENHISMQEIDVYTNYAMEKNIFSRDIFDKYQILTSSGIQRRYLKILTDARRKGIECVTELMLIKIEANQVPTGFKITYSFLRNNAEETKVITEETPVSSAETPKKPQFPPQKLRIITEESAQSKEKQRKEKQQQCENDLLGGNSENFPDAIQEKKAAVAALKKYLGEQKHYVLEFTDAILLDFVTRMQDKNLDYSYIDFLIRKMQEKEKLKLIANHTGFFKTAMLQYDNLIAEWEKECNDPKKQPRAKAPEKCHCGAELRIIEFGTDGKPRICRCLRCQDDIVFIDEKNIWMWTEKGATITTDDEALALSNNFR